MMSKNMQNALNKQVNEELHSAYIYASMACYFEDLNLKGFAHWMRIQTREELQHANKLIAARAGRQGENDGDRRAG